MTPDQRVGFWIFFSVASIILMFLFGAISPYLGMIAALACAIFGMVINLKGMLPKTK